MQKSLIVAAFATLTLMLHPTPQATAGQLCLDPVGDLDGSGITNVVDVQCELLSILWTLGGETGAAPACLAGPPDIADVSCDSTTSVVDGVLIIKLALGESIGELDLDANGCPDDCEPAVCGDGSCGGDETCDGCPADCGACPDVCGDGACGPTEGCADCALDCGICPDVCGDGACGPTEGCADCAADCGACPDVCGDGTCGPTEGCADCAADCGACPDVCGDGTCGPTEGCADCADDCGACPDVCGDGTCGPTEGCADCEVDCGACPDVCGDATCGPTEGCGDCPIDCGTCPAVCGNGSCEPGEACSTCEADCGECCGDGFCNPDTENCTNCIGDCGECPVVCGDGSCDDGETCQNCPTDCPICEPICGDFFCNGDETCETCPSDCQCAPECGDGVCNGLEDGCTCSQDCGECTAVCGDGNCTPGAETCADCSQDCGECPSECGDGNCDAAENCADCPQDCGTCTTCGDGTCDPEETCQSCPDDCPICPPECGDFFCNGDETCDTCPGDCGECAVCGDGTCAVGDETCEDCPADCGICPAVCGDDTCEQDENCGNCALDCGACPAVCGDDICEVNNGEDCLNCAVDCPQCACGDGVCQSPLETCASCSDDCGACPDPTNSCCETSLLPGCIDADTEGCVCAVDASCCNVAWTQECVDLGKSGCNLDCPVSGTLDCCISHVDPGCEVPGETSGGATTHDVVISGFAFSPLVITIKAGDTVKWTSNDAFHTVNSESPAEPFDSPMIGNFATQKTFEYTYTVVGTHQYGCDLHSGMELGTVIVEAVAATCSECVCEYDNLCCTALWDASCVGLGATVCDAPCNCAEGPITQSCCEPGSDGGCASQDCMECVCEADELCCSDVWDVDCALLALGDCNNACAECAPSTVCCDEHFSPNCANNLCTDCVCAQDDTCCTIGWDESCVTLAEGCTDCGCVQGDGCSETSETPGSSNEACNTCVCAEFPECCTENWTSECAELAGLACNYACGCADGGVSDTCDVLWDCASQCTLGDQECYNNCGYLGSLDAQALYGPLLDCSATQGCQEDGQNIDTCAQEFCTLKYGDCHANPPGEDCCSPHASAGCPVPLCENCVESEDLFCTLLSWDSACVAIAQTTCLEQCVCVPDTPLEECAEVLQCILQCPDNDDGTCRGVCQSKGLGEAPGLMATLATCLEEQECIDNETSLGLLACGEGLCTSSYNLCLGHQVASECCAVETQVCTDNTKCVECVVTADPFCETAWDADCVSIAQSGCNGLCNCTPASKTLTCAEYDACINACDDTDQLCIGDCVAGTPLDEYLKHADLMACAYAADCHLTTTPEDYNLCLSNSCPQESFNCLGPPNP